MIKVELKWERLGTKHKALYLLDENEPTQSSIGYYLSKGSFYEASTSDIFNHCLSAGDAVIDIGAHVGYFSILAAQLVGATGSVVSIEADSKNYEALCDHIVLNAVSWIESIHAAAWSKDAPVSLWMNLDNDGGHALWDPAQHPANPKTEELKPGHNIVDGISLKTIINKLGGKRPRLLKIDVEGAEYDVFCGLKDVPETLYPELIIAELNGIGLRALGHSIAELRKLMHSFGYECFLLGPNAYLPRWLPLSTELDLNITDGEKTFEAVTNVVFMSADKAGEIWPKITP